MDFGWTSRIVAEVKNIAVTALDLCFPQLCAGCGNAWRQSADGCWCAECKGILPLIEPPLCTCCGLPFLDSPLSGDHLCEDCRQESFLFDSARSAVLFEGIVRKRIHELKFGGCLHWAPALGELLIETFRKQYRPPPTEGLETSLERNHLYPDLIVPVPLHIRRLRQRGFNQSAFLAKTMGHRLGIPVHYRAMARKNWTEPQTRLNRRERLKNVKGAFAVPDPLPVRDRSILLVDDVFTTGTTLNECARALKAAGAAEVHVLTVARALPHRSGDIPPEP